MRKKTLDEENSKKYKMFYFVYIDFVSFVVRTNLMEKKNNRKSTSLQLQLKVIPINKYH